ncbi:MAG: NAD(P)-dependent oxidoreductase [Rubrobacter sp.]|nr:NAD(P)-dependent oxidoreductase [Rubrobacter sp.]
MEENITVAVLGTGNMGAGIARNLLADGMEVRAWNRTREKAEPLADDGVDVVDTPAEAAQDADFVITILPDVDAVEEVVRAEDSPLSVLSEDGVWIQTSTVGEEGSERLADVAAEHDIIYVDAPVLGTKEPAEQGQLVVLASGPEEALQRCQPIFEAIGSKTLWLEPAGAGSRLKLVTNSWLNGLLALLAETISLARALGVDPAHFLEAVEGGPLDAPYVQMKGQMMIDEEFPTSFSVNLAQKDSDLVLEAAQARDLHLLIAEAVNARFEEASDAGYGEEDMAAVYEVAKPERS